MAEQIAAELDPETGEGKVSTTQIYAILRAYQEDLVYSSLACIERYFCTEGEPLSSFLIEAAYMLRAYQPAWSLMQMAKQKLKTLNRVSSGPDTQAIIALEDDLKMRIAEETTGQY